MDRFIENRPFDTWRKSKYWKTVDIHDSVEFGDFKRGFPVIIFDNTKSRVGKNQRKKRARNDIFNFCYGPYQPEEARIYLRHSEFIQNHFSAQLFQFETVSDSIKKNFEHLLTGNAFSKYPTFDEPSQYLSFHYNDWYSHNLQLIRFKVPSRHFGSTFYTVFIVYAARNETESEKLINDEPDGFFQFRIVDYQCNCQVGLRSLGSCVHVGES